MNGIYTILLLCLSNIFMTLAWYGHLRLQQTGVTSNWPLIGVIVFSWGIAFFEYCCQVPANRIGFQGNGGPFSLVQIESHPGVHLPYSVCHYCQRAFSRTVTALEPHSSILLSCCRRVSCLYEIGRRYYQPLVTISLEFIGIIQ